MFQGFVFVAVLLAFGLVVRSRSARVETRLPQLAMALITPGPMVGEASGRIGGTIFSHNRGGMYVRNGVVPTKRITPYTEEVRGVLSICSRLWGSLTDEDRSAWTHYTTENPVVNRLGQKKTLAGNMAFNAINARLLQSGDAHIDLPPNGAAPDPITSLSAVVDSGDGSAVLTFAPTPTSAHVKLWVWAACISKPGVKYLGNKWRLVHKSTAAVATGLDVGDDLIARFGTLQAGDFCAFRVQTLDKNTGLVSGFVTTATIAIA